MVGRYFNIWSLVLGIALLLVETVTYAQDHKSVRDVYLQYKGLLEFPMGVTKVGTTQCPDGGDVVGQDEAYPLDNCIVVMFSSHETFEHMTALYGETFKLGGYTVWVVDPAIDPAVSVHN